MGGIRLGLKVKRRPSWMVKEKNSEPTPPITGYVSYIHPKGRFYTVTFPFKAGKIRESYFFGEEG